MLPTFVIIGAMKSGTTSLHRYLSMHPEIFMARAGKTKPLHFFVREKNYSKGIPWYESHFSGQAKAYGEASGTYTKYPRFSGVPQRMHAIVPEAKLIYLLRDPVDRIISHYVHNYLEGSENRALSTVLSNLADNHYVACSKYYMQLEQYFSYYPKEQILIITSDELKNQRQATLKNIFRFLEVDDSFYSPEYETMFHQSSEKARQNKIGRYLSELSVTKAIKSYVPSPIIGVYKRITAQPFESPKLDKELEKRLIEYLKGDVEALRKYTGNEFVNWRV